MSAKKFWIILAVALSASPVRAEPIRIVIQVYPQSGLLSGSLKRKGFLPSMA